MALNSTIKVVRHPVTHAHYGNDAGHPTYGCVTWALDKALGEAQHASLRRQDLGDADMDITLSSGEAQNPLTVQARLSQPEAAGDGTVPAAASAQAVEQAGQEGVMVGGNGYTHEKSFDPKAKSEGPHAALHAVLHMLKTTGVAR